MYQFLKYGNIIIKNIYQPVHLTMSSQTSRQENTKSQLSPSSSNYKNIFEEESQILETVHENPMLILCKNGILGKKQDLINFALQWRNKDEWRKTLRQKFLDLPSQSKKLVANNISEYLRQIDFMQQRLKDKINYGDFIMRYQYYFYDQLMNLLLVLNKQQNKQQNQQNKLLQKDKKQSTIQKIINWILWIITWFFGDFQGKDCLSAIMALKIAWDKNLKDMSFWQAFAFFVATIYIALFIITLIIKLIKKITQWKRSNLVGNSSSPRKQVTP